ncbi:MAG: baseplate J/gp47 family protein [Terrisporobacter sp.]|uniref:baseplate J/gp47 family protein n=1 Tax=Terrisporobacter sp. TaxID=1965305 RepID=UPI002A91916C|nr:baseplate J/gp47 family protein [Terrisporobacter sp.]MDY6154890.1 baseplate J/gp47 family protein [Terrisporobacter sp.]
MFSNQTYEVIKQRIFDNTNINIDKREGSFLSNMVSPLSEELAKAYINMSDILSLGFIEDTFDTYLDKRVSEFGVYRKQGSKATGEIKVEGQDGATITNGTLIRANDLYFTVLNDIELPTDNILYVEANEVGYKYNLLANTEFELVEKNDKVTSLINESDFKNGVDIESDEDLRKRFVKVVNNPSTSGNKAHYEEWALEVDGVGRAIVYPLWNGNGTVKVMVIGNDNKPVAEDIINNCKLHIEENMPIGCQLTVITASLLNVSVKASIELKEGYTLEDIKSDFENNLNEYLKEVTTELTYSKVYGLLANHVGVEDMSTLKLNNSSNNIAISEDKIINISEIILSEVV